LKVELGYASGPKFALLDPRLVYLESGRKLAERNFSELSSLVPQFDKNALANGA
jgi:hypothetical protein